MRASGSGEIFDIIKRADIVQEPGGRYYANLLVDRQDMPIYPNLDREIGVDLGLTAFLTTDSGEKNRSHSECSGQ